MERTFDARSALSEAGKLLKGLVNQLAMPVRILDSDRRILHENGWQSRQYANADCSGRACRHQYTEIPGRGCPYCEMEQQLRAGRTRELRAKFDGLDCLLRFEPVEGEDGTVARVDALLLPWT